MDVLKIIIKVIIFFKCFVNKKYNRGTISNISQQNLFISVNSISLSNHLGIVLEKSCHNFENYKAWSFILLEPMNVSKPCAVIHIKMSTLNFWNWFNFCHHNLQQNNMCLADFIPYISFGTNDARTESHVFGILNYITPT